MDIAAGLPTALTLACEEDETGAMLQEVLSTPGLRFYRTTDVIGAELGGAAEERGGDRRGRGHRRGAGRFGAGCDHPRAASPRWAGSPRRAGRSGAGGGGGKP